MCRKCGEIDRRGPAAARRRRRARLLAGENGVAGNGVLCVCVWCGGLLGNTAGTIHGLEVQQLELDRLEQGGPYAMWNLVPSCPPCNRRRAYERLDFVDGCYFGPEQASA